MDVETNHKLIHRLKSDIAGFEASLLLEETNRQYALQINIFNQNRKLIDEKDILVYLTELFNYYQRLITPPIIAAPQVEFVDRFSDLQIKRSAPGMGKINGRTRLKIIAYNQAKSVGQLFRQLYLNETYGLSNYPQGGDLSKLVGKLFKL